MKRLTTKALDGEAGCILADCQQYRYHLWREWDRSQPGPGFIMRRRIVDGHGWKRPSSRFYYLSGNWLAAPQRRH